MLSSQLRFWGCLYVVLAGWLFALPTLASDAGDTISRVSAVLPPNTAAPAVKTQDVTNYELLVSAAEKVGRDLRTEQTISVSGARTRALWMLPTGADLERTFAAVSAELEGEELFRCVGRGCGRSTAWATFVYSEALVVGQDRFQRYRAVRKSADELLSAYVIQRGNRRIHVMLEVIKLDASLSDAAIAAGGVSAFRTLSRLGVADLVVVPPDGGEFSTEALRQLEQIGQQLAGLTGGTVYVVCHLYGSAPADELVNTSTRCAQQAQSALEAGYSEGVLADPLPEQTNRARPASVNFLSFGAGPLLPRLRRDSALANRLELVRPNQLARP